MKISEIRNNLFGLSDLKGLINESIESEDRGADSFDWQGFFAANPERRNMSFLKAMGLEKAPKEPMTLDQIGDSEMRKHFGDDTILKIHSDPTNFIKDKGIRNRYDSNRKKYVPVADREIETELPLNQTSNDNVGADTVSTDRKTKMSAVDFLYFYFNKNGGNTISYDDTISNDKEALENYLTSIFNISKSVWEEVGSIKFNEKLFNQKQGIVVGDATNPFSLFLLFYYVRFISNTGGTNRKDAYIENITPGYTREYVKYLLDITPNIFHTINSLNGSSLNKVREVLVGDGFGGEEMSGVRASAYYEKYKKTFPNHLNDEEVQTIAKSFIYNPDNIFDPLAKISDTNIIAGFQYFCKMYAGKDITSPGNALNSLKKPTLVQNQENGAPIEKIFIMAKTIGGLLDTDFGSASRLGAAGRNVLSGPDVPVAQKIDVLFSSANDGVKLLEEDAKKRNLQSMPKRIGDIRTMCDSRLRQNKELRFWNLLARDSGTKTQDEIFYFLSSVSDPNIDWESEYNRFDRKVDKEGGKDGLGSKSIDIMGTKTENGTEKKLCFEYQGEGHYRPFTVRKSDYDYSLYTEMRDEILAECGFTSKVGINGTKYFSGFENLDAAQVKEKIFSTYEKYAKLLGEALQQEKVSGTDIITPRFNLVKEASSVGRKLYLEKLSKYTVQEAYDYFRGIVETGKTNPELFNPSSLNGVVPYLCSPVRFMDEVETAQARERDLVKNAIIMRRKKLGWEIAYVTPKISSSFSEEDLEYTKNNVANGAKVFTWDEEGKKLMIEYLIDEGFKTNNEGEKGNRESLFEQIVKEILTGYSVL